MLTKCSTNTVYNGIERWFEDNTSMGHERRATTEAKLARLKFNFCTNEFRRLVLSDFVKRQPIKQDFVEI